jgi:hypothetical protein
MTPLLVSLWLSTSAVAAPAPPPAIEPVTATLLRKAPPSVITKRGLRLELVREPGGKVSRLIVKRQDGRPMTCDAYMALMEQEYACYGGQCYTYNYLETGSGFGSTQEDACAAARSDMCASSAGCPSYQFCYTLTDWSGVLAYEQGGGCVYYYAGTCGGGACH